MRAYLGFTLLVTVLGGFKGIIYLTDQKRINTNKETTPNMQPNYWFLKPAKGIPILLILKCIYKKISIHNLGKREKFAERNTLRAATRFQISNLATTTSKLELQTMAMTAKCLCYLNTFHL